MAILHVQYLAFAGKRRRRDADSLFSALTEEPEMFATILESIR